MKTIFNIAKTELKTLFFSPIAWLILLIFTIQSVMPFMNSLADVVRNFSMGYGQRGITSSLFTGRDTVLPDILQYLYLYIPLLTMGLVSKEINTGSIKLLLSSPIPPNNIVFGKFLAMVFYGIVLMIPLVLMTILSSFIVENFDLPYVLSGLLGIYLLICAYSAIGLFMSSLTSYQVVAAMGTLAVLAVLNFIGEVGQDIAFVRDLTYWLSITGRTKNMIYGLISTEGIFYFIAVIGMFLSFTIIKFQSGKVKNNLKIAVKYATVVVITLMLGYISSRPVMKKYADLTATKSRTLTQASQDIIKKLDGDLTITTYVNLLDDSRYHAMPAAINDDKSRFQQYTRFKPEIKMKYVYYWDRNLKSSYFYERYPNMTDEEIAKKICDIYDWDFDDFLRPEEIRKIIDLSGEKNHFVRQIVRGNGQKTWLRIFDDMYVHPSESEISAALKKMIVKAPKVGFLTGHGERDIKLTGDKNYGVTTCSKGMRSSLLNQGFDYGIVDLSKGEVPKDISIIVISDMKQHIVGVERERLMDYINKGGNILIAAEPRRRSEMKDLVNVFGLDFVDGIMVRKNENFLPTLSVANLTVEGVKKTSYKFNQMLSWGQKVCMPEALTFNYSDAKNKGFEVTPLLVTDTTNCWNELETTDFVDGDLSLNTKIGEKEYSAPMALALTRNINNRQQRVMILGDADCISNGEISANHTGIWSSNFGFFIGMFEWLSDGKMPIKTVRPKQTDNKIYIKKAGFKVCKTSFLYILPILIVIAYLSLWITRRKK
jgi:ABC-2 type transport system permease protein